MDQYDRIFSTTRIPVKDCDEIRVTPPLQSLHANVIVNEHVYELPVSHRGSLDPLSVVAIYAMLKAIVSDARGRPRAPSVFAYTSDNRDEAAKVYLFIFVLTFGRMIIMFCLI